jgi:H+/Cl- antiporter ClcA
MWFAYALYIAAGIILVADAALIALGAILAYQEHGGQGLIELISIYNVTNWIIAVLAVLPAVGLIAWGRKAAADARAAGEEDPLGG